MFASLPVLMFSCMHAYVNVYIIVGVCAYIYIYMLHIITDTFLYTLYNIFTICLFLSLSLDTYIYNSCPLARFLLFLTTVVNFGFRTFWADLTLLCVKNVSILLGGKGQKYPGKGWKYPGRFNMTQN